MMRTFPDLAARIASLESRVVLACEGRHFTGGEVTTQARRIARALLAAGVRRGDRVCLWVPNRPEFIFVELAVTLIGAIFVPIQSRYGATELGNILGRVKYVGPQPEPTENEIMDMVVEEIRAVRGKHAKGRSR